MRPKEWNEANLFEYFLHQQLLPRQAVKGGGGMCTSCILHIGCEYWKVTVGVFAKTVLYSAPSPVQIMLFTAQTRHDIWSSHKSSSQAKTKRQPKEQWNKAPQIEQRSVPISPDRRQCWRLPPRIVIIVCNIINYKVRCLNPDKVEFKFPAIP